MMYYGITIGPIVETLMHARKLKELWFASYIFSYVMKQIAKELRDKKATIFLPYIDKDMLDEKDKGIGLFPDRLIFQSDLGIEEIEEIVNEAKEELVKKTTTKLNSSYLKEHINVKIAKVENVQKPIQEISPILNTIDYYTPLTPFDESFFKILNKDNINKMPLTKECGVGAYESVGDIAKKSGKGVASKYVAIVHADGDNLSKAVRGSEKDTSQNLAAFAKKAKEILQDFATLLYMGGDDLLFLAPLRYGETTILDKLKELDACYREFFNDKSTLSFGVSITYEKYPLYEALEKSRSALFGKAKNYPGKNAIAIDVRKHSGQSFTTTMGLQEDRFRRFNALLNGVLGGLEFPKSMHFKLKKLEPLLQKIEQSQIDNIFENFFNEEIHQTRFKEGLQETKELLKLQRESFSEFFAQISIIKLLSAKDEG